MHQAASIPAVLAIELAIRRTTQELERRAHTRDARRLHAILDQARGIVSRAIPRQCRCRDKGCVTIR